MPHLRTNSASNPETNTGLTPEQLDFWNENGYLIIPDVLDRETVLTLLSTIKQMLADFSLDDHPMTKFTSGDNNHVGDDYFLTSGDKIRFFFEEDAFDPQGNLIKPKSLSINKIGHALHSLSPRFRHITLSPYTRAIARSLAFQDPEVLQSMVICKQPEIGGAVPPHQDSTFLFTDPPSAVGFWYALEDATVENGCLKFLAGSQGWKGVGKRFVRMPGGGTGFRGLERPRFPVEMEFRGAEGEGDERYTIGEVKAGTLVLIHGNLLHKSERNTSGRSRYIYTFHVIEGGCEYDKDNWLQPGKEGFSKLYGEDGEMAGGVA